MATNLQTTHSNYKETFDKISKNVKNGSIFLLFKGESEVKGNIYSCEVVNTNGFNYETDTFRHLINIIPGFVLQTRYLNDDRGLYINVTASVTVPRPYLRDDRHINDKWFLPHALTDVQTDVLVTAEVEADTYDLIINPSCLNELSDNKLLKCFFAEFVQNTLLENIKIKVYPINEYKLSKYIGASVPDSCQATVYSMAFDPIKFLKDVKIVAHDFDKNGYMKQNDPNGASYQIKYLNENTDESSRNHVGLRPSLISIEFFLPNVLNVDDIDLETEGKELRLKTKNGIFLELEMDYPVLKDPTKSVFFKDTSKLYLELKINETGHRKINLGCTSIETNKCADKEENNHQSVEANDEDIIYVLPEYRITQSNSEYTLTIISNGMIKESLKHFYIGNDAFQVSFNRQIPFSACQSCRFIFDVSPKKLNCANSFLNQTKKSLTFTIRKASPKISCKAKIGCYYESLEDIKILYSEKKNKKKKGQPSQWINDSTERTRSLSESSTSDFQSDDENCDSRSEKKQNGLHITKKKCEFFQTSSWPRGILKRSCSMSESTSATSSDSVFDDCDNIRDSNRTCSLSSSYSLLRTYSTDSSSWQSGMESSLEDLTICGSSPQKKVAFSGVILKEVYSNKTSIIDAKNKKEYYRQKLILKKKIKRGDTEAQKELNKLEKFHKESYTIEGEGEISEMFNNLEDYKVKYRKKSHKKQSRFVGKEDLLFNFDDDYIVS